MWVKSWPEVADDPHTRAREMVVKMKQPFIGEIVTYGSPFKMSETSSNVRGYAPLIGENTREVLAGWLDLSADEINSLYKNDVVYTEDAVARLPEELKRLGIRKDTK